MEELLQQLAGITPEGGLAGLISSLSPAIYLIGCGIILGYIILAKLNPNKFRLTDAETGTDLTMGLLMGAISGALTGLLWWSWNPIKVVPPYIHLRIFSFFVPLVGIIFGRGTGFICGWIATMVWAPLSGAFTPLHTPIFDGIFVGLTGWLPAVMIRGDKTKHELLDKIQTAPVNWYLKIGAVCLFAGLFMAFFVAASLEILTPLTFWTAFWAIGVISDTAPMLIFTAPSVHALLKATRKAWTWMPNF